VKISRSWGEGQEKRRKPDHVGTAFWDDIDGGGRLLDLNGTQNFPAIRFFVSHAPECEKEPEFWRKYNARKTFEATLSRGN